MLPKSARQSNRTAADATDQRERLLARRVRTQPIGDNLYGRARWHASFAQDLATIARCVLRSAQHLAGDSDDSL